MSNLSRRVDAVEKKLRPPRVLSVWTNSNMTPEERRQLIEEKKEEFGFGQSDHLLHRHVHYETKEGADAHRNTQ